jgi:hypothetical protein
MSFVSRAALMITGALVGASLAGASPMIAEAKPVARVSITLPASASAGATTAFSFATRHIPPSAQLVVQRQEGTAHVWKEVLRLTARAGAGRLPALQLGIYPLRIAAFAKHARLLASTTANLDVFGSVPLGTVVRGYPGEYSGPYGNGGHAGSYPTATSTFDYVLGLPEYRDFPTPWIPTEVSATRNHCRALHVDFLPGNNDGAEAGAPPAGFVGTLSVAQATLDLQSASAPYETPGHLDATLVPGTTWGFRLSDNETNGNVGVAFFLNGSADCDSTAPFWS